LNNIIIKLFMLHRMKDAGETLRSTEGVSHEMPTVVKLSGKRTVFGRFSGKLRSSTEGAILIFKKNLSGQDTGKCIGGKLLIHDPVFYLN